MAHEIEEQDNFGEVRVRGLRAWHGLGIEIPAGMKAVPAFTHVGIDWGTELIGVFAQYKDDGGRYKQFKLPDHAAHVRADTKTLLGVVGSGYKPISNKEMAEFADSLVDADKSIEVETAGSLRNGKVVFCLIRLPQDIVVADGDILKQYILLSNNHDGGGSFKIYPTSIRVVCANTLRMSERDLGRGIQFQHTGDISAKKEQARLTLGLITDATKQFEAQVRVLAAKHVTKDQVREYFKTCYDMTFGVVPAEAGDDTDRAKSRFERQLEKRDVMLDRWTQNLDHAYQSMDGVRGTLWAAYNAVSQWHDHERGRFEPVSQSSARVHSNLFGTANNDKLKAFKEALALT